MPSFTATTHEAATIARAGMGGTVAIVRRLKVQPYRFEGIQALDYHDKPVPLPLSPGKPVWVKEGWGVHKAVRRSDPRKNIGYRADRPEKEPQNMGVLTMEHLMWAGVDFFDWKPAITMPRWASRFTLTPETERVCRVQDVGDDEVFAAGVRRPGILDLPEGGRLHSTPQECFAQMIARLHGPAMWHGNPWVMVALCKIGGVE